MGLNGFITCVEVYITSSMLPRLHWNVVARSQQNVDEVMEEINRVS